MVKLLIAKGADLNTKDQQQRRTSLHYAAENGRITLVELLIAKGANVNAKAKKGVRPLALAGRTGDRDLIELLKRHGAKQ